MTTRQPTIYGNRAFVFIVDLTQSDSDTEQPIRRRRRRQPQVIDLTRNQPEIIDLTNDTNQSINRVLANLETNVPRTRRRIRNSNNQDREADKENIPPTTNTSGSGLHNIEAYCVKCKRKEPMIEPKEITTKNGRKAMSGKCAICSTKMMKFIKK